MKQGDVLLKSEFFLCQKERRKEGGRKEQKVGRREGGCDDRGKEGERQGEK